MGCPSCLESYYYHEIIGNLQYRCPWLELTNKGESVNYAKQLQRFRGTNARNNDSTAWKFLRWEEESSPSFRSPQKLKPSSSESHKF
jgi:hypothetical protein